ncbi:hypothetical protein Syun_006842 [Stephania yunnanensis]|uniref:F-box domain-containing protein n=1 Tax=Stephania yunnanensis TaxID=152371 RepID=A0AAP0KXM6_9MAGN
MQTEEKPLDLQVLPEGCISNVISLTSPRDACRLSLISTIFKRAGESDAVWERFLPSDYQAIISRSTSPVVPPDLSKKDLYFFLCDNPILIDGGLVDKCTGKKIYMLGARDLSITWGSTPEHWRWRALSESRFAEVAELLAVCWLEIIGKIETRMLSSKTIYKAYLVIKFGDGMYGLQRSPANVSVSVGGNASGSKRLVYMCTEDDAHITNLRTRSLELEGQFPKNREDGWMEIEMGELFNHEGEDGEVKMTLTETKGGHWKGGLIVLGLKRQLRENEQKNESKIEKQSVACRCPIVTASVLTN